MAWDRYNAKSRMGALPRCMVSLTRCVTLSKDRRRGLVRVVRAPILIIPLSLKLAHVCFLQLPNPRYCCFAERKIQNRRKLVDELNRSSQLLHLIASLSIASFHYLLSPPIHNLLLSHHSPCREFPRSVPTSSDVLMCRTFRCRTIVMQHRPTTFLLFRFLPVV